MLNVTDRQVLDRYMAGVLTRAGHHAAGVVDAAVALRGFVETFGKDLELYGDGLSNVIWFRSRRTGRRYAMSYDHGNGKIDLRERSLQGKLIYKFDNDSTLEEISQTFRGL